MTITVDMDPGFASLAGRDCVDVLLQLGSGESGFGCPTSNSQEITLMHHHGGSASAPVVADVAPCSNSKVKHWIASDHKMSS